MKRWETAARAPATPCAARSGDRAPYRASRRSSRAPSAAMASVLGAAHRARSARRPPATAACGQQSSASTAQSSKPQFMPWPWKGTMACAASPEQQHAPGHCQGTAVHGAELALRMLRRTRRPGPACAPPRRGIRARRSACTAAGARQRREAHRARARQEQRRREAAIGVGQRDQHEAAARPDVQRLALERVRRRRRARRDDQFLVVVIEPVLADAHRARRAAGSRARRSRRRRCRSWA